MSRLVHQPAQRGFTLIETVVSASLLALAATVIISLNANLFLQSTQVRNLHQGTQLLQACADRVITMRRISGYAGPFDCNAINTWGTGFTLNVSNNTPSTPQYCPSGAQCNQVTITVSPTGGSAWAPLTLLFLNY